MKKPDCWLYEEFDTNGQLRSSQIWTFLPSDLKQTLKLKDVHHVELTPMYKDIKEKLVFNKENKYDSKRITEAYCGL